MTDNIRHAFDDVHSFTDELFVYPFTTQNAQSRRAVTPRNHAEVRGLDLPFWQKPDAWLPCDDNVFYTREPFLRAGAPYTDVYCKFFDGEPRIEDGKLVMPKQVTPEGGHIDIEYEPYAGQWFKPDGPYEEGQDQNGQTIRLNGRISAEKCGVQATWKQDWYKYPCIGSRITIADIISEGDGGAPVRHNSSFDIYINQFNVFDDDPETLFSTGIKFNAADTAPLNMWIVDGIYDAGWKLASPGPYAPKYEADKAYKRFDVVVYDANDGRGEITYVSTSDNHTLGHNIPYNSNFWADTNMQIRDIPEWNKHLEYPAFVVVKYLTQLFVSRNENRLPGRLPKMEPEYLLDEHVEISGAPDLTINGGWAAFTTTNSDELRAGGGLNGPDSFEGYNVTVKGTDAAFVLGHYGGVLYAALMRQTYPGSVPGIDESFLSAYKGPASGITRPFLVVMEGTPSNLEDWRVHSGFDRSTLTGLHPVVAAERIRAAQRAMRMNAVVRRWKS